MQKFKLTQLTTFFLHYFLCAFLEVCDQKAPPGSELLKLLTLQKTVAEIASTHTSRSCVGGEENGRGEEAVFINKLCKKH